ncbi:hypothetical protein JZU46_02975 [bacterium]|nr:hypothetical protein [bacterium]
MQTSTGLYFKDGELITTQGEVTIYKMDENLFLEIGPGHNLCSSESEYTSFMEQLGDKPKGSCLEIGLGLGIASRCILTYPNVTNLTTIEIRKNVIRAHEVVIPLLDEKIEKWDFYDRKKHTIINYDGLMYMLSTKNKFDFIFMDFYKIVDEDTLPLIKDMVACAKTVLRPGGKIAGWLDPYTPVEYVEEFLSTFN